MISELNLKKPDDLTKWRISSVLMMFISMIAFQIAVAQSESPYEAVTSEDIFWDMLETSITTTGGNQTVAGTDGQFSFGAEKEGSSSLLTRIMGPNTDETLRYLKNLDEERRSHFLRNFLIQWLGGDIQNGNVVGHDGKAKNFSFTQYTKHQIKQMDGESLERVFTEWLAAAGDSWFSFINSESRRKIFDGTFPGQNGRPFGKHHNNRRSTIFSNWVPIYGLAEKYIMGTHNTSVGWEINFHPMYSFAEAVARDKWFTETLKNAGKNFGLPGHRRMVFPKRAYKSDEEAKEAAQKLSEIYKNLQGYIVLKGQMGKAGMEFAHYKTPATDKTLQDHASGERAILRLEDERFGPNTSAIEIRGGTKSEGTIQLVEATLIARYGSNDFSGIARADSWVLLSRSLLDDNNLINRFKLPRVIVEAARQNIANSKKSVRGDPRDVDFLFLTPLWGWENSPYLSQTKKEALANLTRAFLISAASWKNPNPDLLMSALQSWAISSNLTQDIVRHLTPHRIAMQANKTKARFDHPQNGRMLDVNQIDLGIEFTARFPIALTANYAKNALQTQNFGWLNTKYDLTVEERRTLLIRVASSLATKLGGDPSLIVQAGKASHANSVEMGFEFPDRQGRILRVEWDGIGRDYDLEGNIIDESIRGGHIEVVTPKFVPTPQEIAAIFSVFNEMNLVPSNSGGGGHINIDLEAFKANPRALARFISIFDQHKGIISLLFQHPKRLRAAEPVQLSKDTLKKLSTFNGTDEELKTILYNERWFNTRAGRKTRYVQLDLSGYFQDVIPPEFIQEDFNIKLDQWRKNFRVDPSVRKAEFRLFNAPSDEETSWRQIELVRGLLNYALNVDSSLDANSQPVDYERYVRNPDLAFADLDKLMEVLQLKESDYRKYLIEGLVTAKNHVSSSTYQPLEVQLKGSPKVAEWSDAVPARSQFNGISSEGRNLSNSKSSLSRESDVLISQRLADRDILHSIRERQASLSSGDDDLNRTESDEYLERMYQLANRGKLKGDDLLLLIFENIRNGPRKVKAKKILKAFLENSNGVFQDGFVKGLARNDESFREWLLTLVNLDHPQMKIALALFLEKNPNFQNRGKQMILKLTKGERLEILSLVEFNQVFKAGSEQTFRLDVFADLLTFAKGIDEKPLDPKKYRNLNVILREGFHLLTKDKKGDRRILFTALDVGLELFGNLFIETYMMNVWPSNVFADVELCKFWIGKIHQIDREQALTIAKRVLEGSNQELKNYAWKYIYENYLSALRGKDSEIRVKAISLFLKVGGPQFSIRVFLALKMNEAESTEVKKDFYSVVKAKTQYEMPLKMIDQMVELVVNGSDPPIEKFVLEIFSKAQIVDDTSHLLNGAIALLDHPVASIRSKASIIFTYAGRSPKPIIDRAFSALSSEDAVIKKNADAFFTANSLDSNRVLTLLENFSGNNQAKKSVAAVVLSRTLDSQAFDRVLSELMDMVLLNKEPGRSQKEIIMEFFYDKRFKGVQSISRALRAENNEVKTQVVRKKFPLLDDQKLAKLTHLLLQYYDFNALDLVAQYILEKNSTSYREAARIAYMNEAFEYLSNSSHRESTIGEKLLSEMNPSDKLIADLLALAKKSSVIKKRQIARIVSSFPDQYNSNELINFLRSIDDVEIRRILEKIPFGSRSQCIVLL